MGLNVMLFGLKEAFAIEAMVEPDLVPSSAVWGRMRIWCKGTSFGDYDSSHCALPAEHLQELSAEVQDLRHLSLDGLLFGCRDGAPLQDACTQFGLWYANQSARLR